ncbi:hypothetical protein FQN50_008285 [Emmonsiellopsis sp. PD_5]|nr:hypothetical protein FQN50_008285 [Emmonsiellopsis sp. PD_5]
MATLQGPLRASSSAVFSQSASYTPALRTIIRSSRPIQRRNKYPNYLQLAPFTNTPAEQGSENKNDNQHDRTTLNPTSTEATKSGTHQDVAGQPAAFKPSSTSPESALEDSRQNAAEHQGKAKGAESGQNPLEVSAANPDVSGSKDEGVVKGREKGPSKRGSPEKGKKV